MNLGRLVFGGPLALGEGLLSTTMYAQPLLSERLEHVLQQPHSIL